MKNSHTCNAIVFTCIDWRLHPSLERLLSDKYDFYDLCSIAGSIKGFGDFKIRGFLLEQIETSKKLHNINKVILTMHRDCGAYGGTVAFGGKKDEEEHHRGVLDSVKSVVQDAFPDLGIETYFIELEGNDGGTEYSCIIL